MDEYLDWMIGNADWLWWSAGVLLLVGEMLIPGVYLLWIGLAAAVTGFFAWMTPQLGFEIHGLVFALLAVISIYIGNKFVYKTSREIDDPQVNLKGQKFIGQRFLVVEAIRNGHGHVQVGDSRWLAAGPDMAKGSTAHVTAVDGTVLVVEPVEG
jgi:membrane protein implicated in regulation of membrane protease activity